MKTFRRCDVRGPVTINNFRKKSLPSEKHLHCEKRNCCGISFSLSQKKKKEREKECCLKDLFIAGAWEFLPFWLMAAEMGG